MLSSRGEIKIHEILENNGIFFEEEYVFPDLTSFSGHPLRFDFAVFDDGGDLDFLIEYQGIQHYEPKSKFGGIAGLRQQQINDMKKRKYCQEHNIKLILVPYWDSEKLSFDYLMKKAGYQLKVDLFKKFWHTNKEEREKMRCYIHER